MKKIVYTILATVSGLVLLFSYRTSLEVVMPQAQPIGSGSASTGTTGTGTASASPETTPEGSASEAPSATATPSEAQAETASGLADGTFTGNAVNTRFGDVQVEITISGGEITEITVPQYPDRDHKDVEINNYALPILISETLEAQSADVSMVSGATYTSQGYTQSLQSALDQAS